LTKEETILQVCGTIVVKQNSSESHPLWLTLHHAEDRRCIYITADRNLDPDLEIVVTSGVPDFSRSKQSKCCGSRSGSYLLLFCINFDPL